MTPIVGVLALQGDYADHGRALRAHGLVTREVRGPADLVGLDAMVLPGGESTTMLRLLHNEGFEAPLAAFLRSGCPVFGTCAGLILLAQTVTDPAQRSFGLLPVQVQRNGYGRQVHSGTFDLDPGDLAADGWAMPPGCRGIFIRAPRVVAVGPGCTVLARRGGDPVLVRSGPILGACFHPELTDDHPVTAYFAEMVRTARRPAVSASGELEVNTSGMPG